MTTRPCGRLRAALSCGVAGCAVLAAMTGSALAQDATTIDAETTAPVATSDTGDLTVAEGGSIILTSGTAVTIDSDDDVIVDGDLTVDGEAADAVGILITGDPSTGARTSNLTLGGTISILSEVQSDRGEQPATFPTGRFGVLLAESAALTGDVVFTNDALVQVDSENGAGVALLGALTGDLTVGGSIVVEGDGASGVLVSGPVSGDVLISAADEGNNAPRIAARGVGANGIAIEGDVAGSLTVSRTVQTRVFTAGLSGDGVTGDDDPDPQLTSEQQAALAAGNALRVTGDVSRGIALTRRIGAVSDDPDTEEDESRAAQTSALLDHEGSSAALYIGGGAAIGANVDDPETELDESYASYGLFNGGQIATSGAVNGASALGVLIEDAAITGGMRNAGGVAATAVGLEASAVAIEFAEGATIGRFLNEGTVRATAVSDEGDAVAIRDRSGTVSTFANRGLIEVALADFADPALPDDDTSDEALPSGRLFAVDLSANTSGISFANSGVINGDVVLGAGDDTFTADGVSLDEGASPAILFGSLDTGAGDDTVVLAGGAFLGRRLADQTPVATSVSLGAGRDTVTVTGEGSLLFADLDFGGGGGALALDAGGSYEGLLINAGDIDVSVGAGSRLAITQDFVPLGSFTTTAAPPATEGATAGPGAVLSFAVAEDGGSIAGFDVAGDVSVADDTTFELVFQAAFDAPLREALITAGGSLDIDLSVDRLSAAGAVPFLFTQSLDLSDDGQSVLVDLRRKTAGELGIAAPLAPAYEPLIDALVAANTDTVGDQGEILLGADVAVGRAVFNLPDQARFLAAYEQFLPQPLDAPLTYARVQNDSVTSLVTQRVTSLREGAGPERMFWLQEQSYFVDRNRDEAERGFDGGGFVIALGADTPLGPIDTVGVSASVASARYDEEDGEDFPFDRLTYQVGAYAAESVGALRLDGRVGYGWSNSDSERNIVINGENDEGMLTGQGDVRRTITGEWDGTELSAYGRVLYAGRLGGWDVQPFASLDYLKLEEDAYQESGAQSRTTALAVDDRDATSLRGNAGVIIGREFKTQPSRFDTSIPATIAPRLTLAYSEELDDDPLSATYRFTDGEAFALAQDKPGGAGIVGADIVYENEYARLGIGGSLTASEALQVYMLRVGVGLKW